MMMERIDKMAADRKLPKRSLAQRLLAFGLVLFFLVAAVFAARYLIMSKPKVVRRPPEKMKALVEIMTVQPSVEQVVIEAQGNLLPAREISLQARVSGRVEYLHPALIPGGLIAKDEILLRLDEVDYRLALRQAQDNLALAEADFRLEEGQQEVALKEWQLINAISNEIDDSSKDLALRRPQLAKVKAQLESARTAVEKARVDLERTVIRAPFDLVVRSEQIDLGSEVTPTTQLATLAAVDSFHAEIVLPTAKLSWFTMPDEGGIGGAEVEIFTQAQGPYPGRIISLAPDLDEDGLMARLRVLVDDPLGRETKRPPLLLGAFVEARIKGRILDGVYRLPRTALRENDLVYSADSEDRLRLQAVTVIWRGLNEVLVSKGLEPGQKVVISSLATPIDGMLLKIAGLVTDTETAAARPLPDEVVDER